MTRLRDDSGQSLVEFALTVPMLCIMIVAVVDFARAAHQYQVITDAAREGARMAVIADMPASSQSVLDAIKKRLNDAGISTNTAVTSDNSCTSPTGTATTVEILGCGWAGERGDPASVTIRMPYQFLFLGPFMGWTTGAETIQLFSSVVMRNE